MKMSLRKNLLAATLLGAMAAGAIAQAPAAPAQVAPASAHAHPHHGPRDGASLEQRREAREQRMAQRLNRFKQVLQVTPAQEGAWSAWVNAMKPQQRRAERPNFVEFARMTTPQRIDAMRTVRAQRAAEMDRRGEATKAFYAGLSADQKRVFDERGLRFVGGKHGGKHGGHGRG